MRTNFGPCRPTTQIIKIKQFWYYMFVKLLYMLKCSRVKEKCRMYIRGQTEVIKVLYLWSKICLLVPERQVYHK